VTDRFQNSVCAATAQGGKTHLVSRVFELTKIAIICPKLKILINLNMAHKQRVLLRVAAAAFSCHQGAFAFPAL
jgi:hypothetical protein